MLPIEVLATALAWLLGAVLTAVFVLERLVAWSAHSRCRVPRGRLTERRGARQFRLAEPSLYEPY